MIHTLTRVQELPESDVYEPMGVGL